ncbi:MAG: OsmC family protein, partial [Acidimicrobiales bacterium]
MVLDAELEQIEKYEFSLRYPDHPYGPMMVDEPPPAGADRGPSPTQALAAAVGHCMSSTLYN